MKSYTLFILSDVVCGNIKIRNEKHEQSLTMVNLILKKTNHINGFLTYASYNCNVYDKTKYKCINKPPATTLTPVTLYLFTKSCILLSRQIYHI